MARVHKLRKRPVNSGTSRRHGRTSGRSWGPDDSKEW